MPTILGPEEQQTIQSQIPHSHGDPFNRHIGKAALYLRVIVAISM